MNSPLVGPTRELIKKKNEDYKKFMKKNTKYVSAQKFLIFNLSK